jgi:transposase
MTYFIIIFAKKYIMPKIRYKVSLSREEREDLVLLTKNGKRSSRKVIHALILLNVDEGEFTDRKKRTSKDIAEFLQTGERTIDRIKKRFVEDGLQAALEDKPSEREYKYKIDGEAEAHIIALSCGEAPEGFTRWSLRMLAEKAVELKYLDSVSHETIRRVLKKTN